MSEYKIYSLHMGKAKCAVDLGDGSERGEYVNQDYILNKMGRPHRSISLMYCYYPLDKEFPGRISEVMKDEDISFAWDYPYDDYFPYKGGLEGNTEGEPFTFMRDVRRHGQDVTLTLTVDPHVSDEQLIAIANDLRPFGRLLLRIRYLRNMHQTFLLFFVSAELRILIRRRSKRKQSFHRLLRRQTSGLLISTWLFTGVGLMTLLKEAAQATAEARSRTYTI